ncbi:unnamed protein product [Brassica oleracea var. botrytis]
MIIIIIFIIMVMMRIVCEWSNEDCMKVDEDKLDLSFVISLVRATSILWQASVPLGISRLLLFYLLSLISLSMCFV